jgi:hypothetical protein
MAGIPAPERLALVQGPDNPDEWWVTIDGKCVIGFSGDTAKPRAERYYEELSVIASRAAREHEEPAEGVAENPFEAPARLSGPDPFS